jgi:hypothetical protein
MADTKNLKTNSEKLSELKVRVYDNTAVATYKDTYDIMIMGERRAHTIIATDTFAKMGGEWKQVVSHGGSGEVAAYSDARTSVIATSPSSELRPLMPNFAQQQFRAEHVSVGSN